MHYIFIYPEPIIKIHLYATFITVAHSSNAHVFISQTRQARISDAEFESSVLANLRRAEERKRLIEELKAREET